MDVHHTNSRESRYTIVRTGTGILVLRHYLFSQRNPNPQGHHLRKINSAGRGCRGEAIQFGANDFDRLQGRTQAAVVRDFRAFVHAE